MNKVNKVYKKEKYLGLHSSMLNQCSCISNKATHGTAYMLINFHNFLNTARFLYERQIGNLTFDTIGHHTKQYNQYKNIVATKTQNTSEKWKWKSFKFFTKYPRYNVISCNIQKNCVCQSLIIYEASQDEETN